MALLSGESISKKFDDKIILDRATFSLQIGEKIGVVGRNGSGKTTLLELIAENISPDQGTISKAKNCRIDYIRQEKAYIFEMTLFEFAISARADLLKIKKEMNELEDQLVHNPESQQLIDKLGEVQTLFESEVKIILAGLGFPLERHDERIRNFSGGEKNRAGLSHALAGNGTLLLLDEPTNHLDIKSSKWLENYLKSSPKTVLAISHDRAFLSATVDKVWEINRGKIDFYTGTFQHYIIEREKRRELAEKNFSHQAEKIDKIEKFIQKNMAGQKTKQAQSRQKYLKRLKRLEPPPKDRENSKINMESSGRSFNHILNVSGLSLAYSDVPVVTDITFDLYRGDKVAIVGDNGSGKSTILKALIGQLAPRSGEIRIGSNVEVAYFDQEHTDLILEQSVLETVWELDPMVPAGKIRGYLGRYGFTGDETLKKVSTLSGGEKTKLSLAKLLYHPANFIIFDEPTNHLDIFAREALENSLLEYNGSCLIVSHDRFFLDKVVNRIFHLSDGSIKEYDGNYSYFEEKKIEKVVVKEKKVSSSKQNYISFKEKSRELSKLKKAVVNSKEKISSLEQELVMVESELPSISHTDWEKLQSLTDKKLSLENEILSQYQSLEKNIGRLKELESEGQG